MFYHDTGRLQVFAHTRCGNINMRHYFNVTFNHQRDFPERFSNDLIIVLRNPLDRVVSAINSLPKMSAVSLFTTDILKKVLANEISMEFLMESATFKIHCNPYLYHIHSRPFRIIDFGKLNDYIPKRMDLIQSPVTNSSGYTDPKLVYVENQYFSLYDLEREYETYLTLIQNRDQISIEEWKEKTT